MAPKFVNIHEAIAQMSRLIERAEQGEDIVITRAGQPVVRLVKSKPNFGRVPGVWAGKVRICDDFGDFTDDDDRDWYGESR